MDLVLVLKNAQHADHNIRSQAEKFLNDAVDAQYGPFLNALADLFSSESVEDASRQLAGLYIKNLISAQDLHILTQKQNKWHACDPGLKEQIKMKLLQAIQSPKAVVCHTAAQVLAAYGAVEVPNNNWPNLLPSLFQFINGNLPDPTKVASLECLGYMCDCMDPEEVPVETVNQILNAIIVGMDASRNNEIRIAAVTALNNSLDFTSKNFEVEAERNAIITAICTASQGPHVRIRERAFECFATIADLYYNHLGPYAKTLFELSVTVIRSDDPLVGMQAIELWNTICDQEMNIVQDIEDGEATEAEYLHLAEQAAASMLPLVLECMTKQEDEEADDDTWDIAMASAALLEAFSRTIRDKIIPLVLPFVTANITSTNWHLKEASIMAFGMILDGPLESKIGPLVAQALPVLVTSLQDPIPLVRDTTAWTIGRICELHKSSIASEVLPALVKGLADALADQNGKVVSQACFAVHNLAEACEDESEATTNVLSHFMPMMVEKLMFITANPELDNDNIRSSAYEAVNRMIANSALDMNQMVLMLLEEALNRLMATFQQNMDHHERMNVQSSLCSLIGEVVKKIGVEQLMKYSDRIVELLLHVFNSKGAIAHEDAFLVVGFLAEKLSNHFDRYVTQLLPAVIVGLKSAEEYQVCIVAIGAVGDISRALRLNIAPFCDEIVTCLLELLKSPTMHRSVKPYAISLFSDIALAIEGAFEKYTGVILQVLRTAGEINIDSDDEDMIEYINTLRNSILEAYTGIVQGLSGAQKQDTILPHMDSIVEFLRRSAQDPNRSGEVLKSAVGLLGDLGQIYQEKARPLFEQPFASQLIEEALHNGSDAQEIAMWTQSVRQSVLRGKM